MKTFIADIIPRIQKYSKKLDNLTLLTNQHWVVVDEIANSKTVYIFRPNNELLISKNGKVDKAKWEYLGNNTLLIDLKDESYLFRHGFFDENILALKIDGKEEYAFLVNETKFDKELNSSDRVLEFLKKKYLISRNEKGGLNISLPPPSPKPSINPAPNPDQTKDGHKNNIWLYFVIVAVISGVLIFIIKNSETTNPVKNEFRENSNPNPIVNQENKELINNKQDSSSYSNQEKEVQKDQKVTFSHNGIRPIKSHIWYSIVVFNDKWDTGKEGIAYLVGSRIETLFIDHNLVDPESNTSIINGHCLISFKNADGTINESNDLYFKSQGK